MKQPTILIVETPNGQQGYMTETDYEKHKKNLKLKKIRQLDL